MPSVMIWKSTKLKIATVSLIKKIKQTGEIKVEHEGRPVAFNVVGFLLRDDHVIFSLKKNMNCSTCIEFDVRVPIVGNELDFDNLERL